MQKPALRSLVLIGLGIFALSACSPAGSAPTEIAPTETAPTETAPTAAAIVPTEAVEVPVTGDDFIRGGLMYDNWMTVTDVDVPPEDHPLWKIQTTNTRTGADTWRCKECHGWDYKGVEGAYGSGSHQTGFKGLLGAASMPEEDLLAQLNGTKNPGHDFSPYIQESDLMMLVAFLKEGMIDTAPYINTDKTVNGGDIERGQVLFTEVCQQCHGEDGKMLNFGDEDAPEYLGTIAADNPWEFWHKVSFGQPGEGSMPSGLVSGWGTQDFTDLLAYVQTLPSE